jgi:hypothetical protein
VGITSELTAGLAFVFIPMWQTLACGVGLLLTLPWRGKREAAEQGHEPDEGRAPEEWEDP